MAMTVQQIRDFLANETIPNDAECVILVEGGYSTIESIYLDSDGDVVISDEAE